MDQSGDDVSEDTLGGAAFRLLHRQTFQLLDLLTASFAEHLDVVDDLRVLGVEEELVERVRGGELGIEPNRAGLGLAELGAVGFGQQRRRQAVDRWPWSPRSTSPSAAAPACSAFCVSAERVRRSAVGVEFVISLVFEDLPPRRSRHSGPAHSALR